MALSLKELRTTTALQPPRVLIYGPPGLGKTSLAAEFPNPVLLDIEGGRPAGVRKEDVPGFDAEDLASYDAVMEAIQVLYTDDHQFGTVIVDTVDRFEPLLWARVCADMKWDSIEAPGYGRGYVETARYWREFLDGLNALRRDRGMAVVLIAHAEVGRFDDPATTSYSRYDIRLHKRALGMIQDEVDAILFVNQDVSIKTEDQGFNKKRGHAEGGGSRWVYCEARPSHVAKNRYGLPPKFLYRPGQGFAELAEPLGVGRLDTPAEPEKSAKPAARKAA